MIPEEILLTFDAEVIDVAKDEVLFSAQDSARYFFQVVSGTIKMYNYTEEGKEFVQGIFGVGKSFGEPPLFSDFTYPASAKATEASKVLKLSKTNFFNCLKAHPEIHLDFTKTLSDRLYYKAIILKEVSVHPPEHRIKTFLSYLKKQQGDTKGNPFTVNLTRNEIAELVGLRTETVIRVVKKLEKEGYLQIIDRKVIL